MTKRCAARTWNGGYGDRCSRMTLGPHTDFCGLHGNRCDNFPNKKCTNKRCSCYGKLLCESYEHIWEHYGRWDDVFPPRSFRTIVTPYTGLIKGLGCQHYELSDDSLMVYVDDLYDKLFKIDINKLSGVLMIAFSVSKGHGGQFIFDNRIASGEVENSGEEATIGEETCAICLEGFTATNKFTTKCGHHFHHQCMKDHYKGWQETEGNSRRDATYWGTGRKPEQFSCALCRENIFAKCVYLTNADKSKLVGFKTQTFGKIRKSYEEIVMILGKAKTSGIMNTNSDILRGFWNGTIDGKVFSLRLVPESIFLGIEEWYVDGFDEDVFEEVKYLLFVGPNDNGPNGNGPNGNGPNGNGPNDNGPNMSKKMMNIRDYINPRYNPL